MSECQNREKISNNSQQLNYIEEDENQKGLRV